jgi:DNA-binding MarR family transcriptional regulator
VSAVSDVPRLAAELGILLDELLAEVGPSYVRAGERRGLNAAHAHLLLALDQARHPLTLAALAHRTQRSVTSVGRLVERLSRKDLVGPEEGGAARAGRRVELTESGRAHLRALQADRRERLEHYVRAMGTPQRLRLAGALHLISRRLDEELAHPDLRAAAQAARPHSAA